MKQAFDHPEGPTPIPLVQTGGGDWMVEALAVGASLAQTLPARLQIPPGTSSPGVYEVFFEIEAIESGQRIREKTTFVVPR